MATTEEITLLQRIQATPALMEAYELGLKHGRARARPRTNLWKRAAARYRRNMRALAQELEELQEGRELERDAGAAAERVVVVAWLKDHDLLDVAASIEAADHHREREEAPTCFHCRGIVHPDTGDMRCDGCGRVLSEPAS